ncbi:hypothetical protein C8R46DRAFT_491770 [Mycena filopes]|nr:hypothetical protein C8R46DRAFT_491770 [Mycena filopes]
MRFSATVAVFALFAASATASYTPLHARQTFPDCSSSCFAHPNLGACQAGENECLCKDDTFVNSMFQCIQDACKGQDLATAIADAAGLCAAAGVTLTAASAAEVAATASSSASAPAGSAASVSGSGAPTGSAAQTSPAPSSSSTAPPNGALSATVNTAFVGLAAIGAIALAL